MNLIPQTAFWVTAVYVGYLLLVVVFPRLSAVALATFKAGSSSMVFWLLAIVGGLLIFISLWTPYNTFGDDIRMMKQTGFQFVLVLGLVQAIWAASNSVSEEIEGRTALTLLSKPITRRTFRAGQIPGHFLVGGDIDYPHGGAVLDLRGLQTDSRLPRNGG